MTKIMMNFNRDGSIFFDCENHSDNHDVCTIITTLCNVLVIASEQQNLSADEYKDGHVRISVPMNNDLLIPTFKAVEEVIKQVEEQHPKNVRMY